MVPVKIKKKRVFCALLTKHAKKKRKENTSNNSEMKQHIGPIIYHKSVQGCLSVSIQTLNLSNQRELTAGKAS